MSEWNRGGRGDERGRYPAEDRDRRDLSGPDWRDRERSLRPDDERRSFMDRARQVGRGGMEDWGDPQRAYGDQGGPGSPGYARQDFADPGVYGGARSARGSQRTYGEPDRFEQDRQRADQDRYRSGQTQPERYRQSQGYQGREQGDRGGGFDMNNPPLWRVTDGEADHGWRANMGEHRGRGPKNYTRSDDRIREDVNDRLSDDSWLDASEIEVTVVQCEVTLVGTVNTRDDKRRAEDLAEQVSGVKHVQNNLRVQPQAGAQNAGATSTGRATGQTTMGQTTTGQTTTNPTAGQSGSAGAGGKPS